MDDQHYAEFGEGRFGIVSRSKLARIRQYAGKSILDVGCGPGAYLQALADLDYQVAGVDRNRLFVAKARNATDQVYLADVDAEALSRFDDGSFDTVLLLDIVEHLDHDQRLLEDARRVCRQNVILTVPARMPDSLAGSQLVFGAYMDPTHLRYYVFADLENLFDRVGFAAKTIEGVMRFDPILYRLFPQHVQLPLAFVNRVLLRFSDPKIFTTVWFAVGWKALH